MIAARMPCLLTLVLALAWGCTPIEPVPNEEPQEQPVAETEAATSFAGVWKRPDTGAIFKVEDDGSLVTGNLEKGSWLWVEEGYDPEELFDRFEFRLERSAEGLEGKATFRFVGDSKSYESAWSVTLAGESLEATLEELEIDDEGVVASRTKVSKTFEFEPSVPRAPPTVAHGASDQGGFDMSSMIKAPGLVPLGEGVELGFRVEIETQAAGRVMKHFLAVVGEEGEHWRLESNEGLAAFGASTADSILGLVVEKESGKVVRAVLGKAGEAGKEIKIHPTGAATSAPADPGEEVEVEVPAGTFSARLTTTLAGDQEYKSWVGTEGEVEGVLLKFEGPDGKGKALASEPETQSLDLGESVEARRCMYDNGDELWHSSDEIVKALAGGMVRYKASGVLREIKVISSKAEPQLDWK